MTESTNVKIKTEEPDEAEIRELAAKMVEANKAKALAASVAVARPQPGALLCAPATAVGGQMVVLKFLTITPGTQQQTAAEPRPTSNDKITPAPDEASWKGHFGWDTLGECHIPYIYRCGEKYVAVRMVEIKLLNKYLNCLHADLYSFTCIQSYYITAIEAQLLNEINNKYCDGQFGRDPFTQKDLVVRLKDAYEFYNFLDVCYNKLLCGTTNNEKCGFIMINKESAVPYTVRDGKKFLPLFYFEGEIDNLKLKAEQLTGWDVSYLKFCCKVQGISNELFASETCSVISLTDIKSYFPPETEFEEYWPKKVDDSQLLISVKDAKSSTSTVQSSEPVSENIVTPKIVRTYADRARAFRKKDPGSVSGGGQWTRAPAGPPPGAVSSVLPNNAIQVAIVQQLTPLVRSTANTTTMKTACNYAMADKPDEPMDLKDLPLPSRSGAPVETQDAAASTSATPFAKLRKKAPPKSSAQRQREYRQRIKASKTQSKATRISETERKRNYRLRKAANLALASGSLESTTASSSRSAGRSNDVQNTIQRQLTNQQRQSLAAEPAQTTEQPGTSSDQIEVPDEPMDLKDLPLPSRNDAPIETQDAAASTSATPFAEPPTIAAQKSKAQRQREYRLRIAAFRTHVQLAATRISETERKRNYRLRKAANLALASGSLESTTASSSRSAGRSNDVQNTIQRQLTNQQLQSLAAEPAQTTEQPGTSSDQIEVPDEPIDLKDLPLPSRSNATVETQGAAASTPAMPFAERPKKAAPKSNAQRQREYRQRIAASRTAKSTATRILEIERVTTAPSSCSAGRSNDVQNSTATRISETERLTTAPSSCSAGRSNDVQNSTQRQLTNQQRQYVGRAQSIWNTKWASSIMRFKSTFLDNDFGYACSVCDRLWFKNDLKPITAAHLEVISERFVKENRQFCREEYEMVCNTCKRSLNKKSMPPLAKVNGFSYPNPPPDLPPLDPISERLISPCLPFMQVRRLRHDLSSGIIGQVINVPVDVQKMVKCLPRQLNEDDVINVNIKRNLAHKSVYISGYMSKITIKKWLTALQESSLYRLYKINVDFSRLNPTVPLLDNVLDNPSNRIENISAENTPESEILASRQHTMMWDEEDCLHIAQGHQAKPLNINYDRNVEELSFPSIYFGKPRRFKKGLSITPYMVANSEIRRRDRRGATPQKVLYVAMKLLRLRMVDEIHSTFRNVSVTENVTRRMLEDTEFLKEYVIQNLAFMKTVPNSVQYWASRKRDLFAMIRQLGKPTVFLTIGANEIRWMKLLTILLKLSKKYPEKTAKDLNTSERCTLVSDDPVTCCIYFYKLVDSLMKMLKSKQSYNPFDKYFVKDYFLRIEFQHQGSPHAHILLWLNDDPRETVSENMPRTIELVEKISSVARDDVPNNSIYANQIHKHTFTCTKRGETTCRFGIPYWPMPTTRVLVPMPQSDGRRQTLQQKAKELRASLGEHRYACMDEFLNANGLTYDSYLDIVRSTLRRPTLVFRRNFDELMTNTFNPYLAGEVNSNIDIQFILDDYSCAEYVVEYIIKSARGMGNLRRELTTMMQQHPDRDYTGQLKALSIKLVNAVEMSAQEAAWYLLRQPMSEESRPIVYIPTVWPTERQRCRKRRQQMDREGIDGDSTDVWTKNIIQRYEERPASLEEVYLAEFASWYANANDFVDEEDDVHVDDDEDSEVVPEVRTSRAPKEYRRRLLGRVIRYRRYDIDETVDYKREMVLLYVQFRNEISEILDQNKFLRLFDDNKDTIMERRSLFETNLNVENVTKELEAMMILQNDNDSNLQEEESRAAFVQRSLGEDGDDNVDDVNQIVPRQGFSIAKSRSNRSDSDTNAAGEEAMYRMSKVLQVALSSTTRVIKNTDDV